MRGLLLLPLLLAPPALADPPSIAIDLATVSTGVPGLRRVHGSTGDGGFGVPVAGGLDTEGDGHRDYALASFRASPLGRSQAGEVAVVFGDGTVSGVVDTAGFQAGVLKIAGTHVSELAGSEVWIDDVTGDGLGDLLIARQNFRPDPGRPGAGALSIVAGGAALRTHAATLGYLDLGAVPGSITMTTLVGAAAVDRLGMWVRTGDVTGDGIADLVVSADQEDGPAQPDRGAVYLVRGGAHLAATQTVDLASFGATALAGHLAKIIPPPGASEYHFGATCQLADLDGNGRAEVLAAAALNRAGGVIAADGAPAGSAHGIGGTTDGTLFIAWDDNFLDPWPAGLTIDLGAPPGTRTRIDGGALNRAFGEELLGGLDYDDDGTADLFVGDLVADPTPMRQVAGLGHVLYDAASLAGLTFDLDAPPPGLVTTTAWGGATGDIAADTAMQGDFDGDGVGDLAFGSPHATPFGRDDAGTLHVFFGQSGPWPALVDLLPGNLPPPATMRIAEVYGALGTMGADSGDVLCYSGAAGDVDGDGRDDLLVNEMLGNGVAPGTEDVGNLLVIGGTLLAGLGDTACPPAPEPGCRTGEAGRSKLTIRDRSPDLGDSLAWKWKRGDATTLADFMDPTTSAARMTLCLYDAGPGAQPVHELPIPTGTLCDGDPCWKATGTKGFRYKDKTLAAGVKAMKLKAGEAGKASVVVSGRGAGLGSPPLPRTAPVTLQLRIERSGVVECWETAFATLLVNDPDRLVAKGP